MVTATFPYTSALSIWLATRRVHPALDTYIKVRHRPGGALGGGQPELRPGAREDGWFGEGRTLGPCRVREMGRGCWHRFQMPRPCGHRSGTCSEAWPGHVSSGSGTPLVLSPHSESDGWTGPPTPTAGGPWLPGLAGPSCPWVAPGPACARASVPAPYTLGWGSSGRPRFLQFSVWSLAAPADQSAWRKQESQPQVWWGLCVH